MSRTNKAFALATALTILGIAPAAGGPRSRTENVPYDTPGANVMDTIWIEINSAAEARPLPGERFVSVALTDDSGRPVAAILHQGDQELGGTFCGRTDRPVRLVSREPVHVHVYSGPACADVSIATQGTAAFTFTR